MTILINLFHQGGMMEPGTPSVDQLKIFIAKPTADHEGGILSS
jgi:hypothetical protein